MPRSKKSKKAKKSNRWATKEQSVWLNDHLTSFRTACAESNSTPWLTGTYQEFMDAHPCRAPTAEDIQEAGGDIEKAVKSITEERKKQIYWWFWNRRVPGSKSKKDKNLLSLARKKSRPPQPYQAYMSLYTEKVMPALQQRYDEYKSSLPAGEEPKKWWPFVIRETKKMLNEESEEVKQEVNDYREMLNRGEESLEDFLKKVEAGDVVSAHEHAVAMQQRINKLPATGQYILDQFKAQTTWVGSLFMGGPNPETGKLTTLTVHTGKTLNLNNSFPNATALWKDVENAWERYVTACYALDAADKLHQAYHRLTAEADQVIAPSQSDASSPSPPPDDASDGNLSVSKKRKRSKKKSTSSSPTPETGSRSSSDTVSPTPASQPPVAGVTSIIAEDTASSTSVAMSTIAPPSGATSNSTATATSPRPEDSPSSTVSATSKTNAATSKPPGKVASPPALNYEAQRLQNIARNRELLAKSGLDKAVTDIQRASSAGAGSGSSGSDVPAWITQAMEYFEDIEAGDIWDELLDTWQEFEGSMGYPDGKKRLSAKSRPEELSRWINGGRNYDKIPVPDDVEAYAKRWQIWWTKLQPKPRRESEEWPLPQTGPDNDDHWEPLRRAGPNGMFVAILGLAIWASALKEDDVPEAFIDAVEDVQWVCSTLMGDDEDDETKEGEDKDEDEEGEDDDDDGAAPKCKKRRT